MKEQPETVTIPKAEYEALLRDHAVLVALESAGVDNWEWYCDALEALEDYEQ